MQTRIGVPRLTLAQARRVAVRATGLDRPRPTRVDRRHFRRVAADVDVIQLDSVNVVARAHDLLFHARLGPHDSTALRTWLWQSRALHECWGHVASLMPADAWPLLAHRRHAESHPWPSIQRLIDEHPEFVGRVLDQVAADGPLSVSDLAEGRNGRGGWWGWSPGRKALHWLFLSGRLAVDHRDHTFKTNYDLPRRVLGPLVDSEPVPRTEAIHRLVERATRALGVGTAADIADYHRIGVIPVQVALRTHVAAGTLVEVAVVGWDKPAFVPPELAVPRRVRARALVAPFDPLVWFRPRTQRLLGMHYRIEVYVPAAKRQYGYYVLPFLLGDRLVARVDLKSDRQSGVLRVRGAWSQPDVDHVVVARELAAELRSLATHTVGGPELDVSGNGDLAARLASYA